MRGPGVARLASNFLLLRQKKVTKEKATPSLRPLRCAKGQTCGVSVAGCAVELALRCARRSDIHGESVHEARALRRACSPRNRPAAGAASRGWTAEHQNNRTAEYPFGPSLRSAWPAQRVALAPASRGRAKQRHVWMFFPLCPSGCAEERRVWRIRARDCLSEVKRSEFERDPARPEHRRLPRSEAQGTQTVGSPFLWFLSFGDAKERNPDAGRLPTSALHQSMPLTGHTVLCMDGGHFKKHSYQRISH